MAEKQVTEIHFTNEQAKLIELAVTKQTEIKQGKPGFFGFIIKSLKSIAGAFVSFLVNFITLKNSGKWVSIATIGAVLGLVYKFLVIQGFSTVAMAIVMPGLSELAVVVFGVIGGFMGLQKLAGSSPIVGAAIGKATELISSQQPKEPETPGGENEGA